MPCRFNRLVPDLIDDDYPSSKSDSSDQEDDMTARASKALNAKNAALLSNGAKVTSGDQINGKSSDEDDEICDGLRTVNGQTKCEDSCQSIVITTLESATIPTTVTIPSHAVHLERTSSLSFIPGQTERRRRKLPEIPKNKKCNIVTIDFLDFL